MFRDILHKLKIFFCDDDVEKIYVRDSTVIRNTGRVRRFGYCRIKELRIWQDKGQDGIKYPSYQ